MREMISIIVPVYLGEQWLPRCINSIRNQSYQNVQIILVNDGSPDDSGAVCEQFAKLDARIKVVHKENGGLSDARNAGIKAAEGNYIMFVDEDDFIHPRMAEILYQTMQKTETDIVVCGFETVPDVDKTEYPEIMNSTEVLCFEGQEVMNQLYYRNLLTVVAWNKLYKKSIYEKCAYIKGRVQDDESAIHYILANCRRIAYIGEKLYYYVQRDGSITSGRNWRYYCDGWQAYEERLQFLEDCGYDQMAYFTKEHMLYHVVTYYKKLSGTPEGRREAKKWQATFKSLLKQEDVKQKLPKELLKRYTWFAVNPKCYSVYTGWGKVWQRVISAIKCPLRKMKRVLIK